MKLQTPKKNQNGAIATVDVSLFEQSAGDGLQNIATEDTALPFLKLLSKMSPEVDSVEGAKPA